MNYNILLPLILLCSVFSASAEERWFEVELLLFQRNADINDIHEDLSAENITIDTRNSTPLLKTQSSELCAEGTSCQYQETPILIDQALFDAQENGFQRLDNTKLQLTAQREKLENHAAFKPLLHLAWRMPVESKYRAKTIHIFAGKNFATALAQNAANPTIAAEKTINSGNNVTQATAITAASMTDETVTEMAKPLTNKWAIDGNLKIYLDHYLFIDSQLLIRKQTTQLLATPDSPAQEPQFEIVNSENDVQIIKPRENLNAAEVKKKSVIKEILFDQSRRLRSGEIHYFDHPLMGMLVQIRKIPDGELTAIEANSEEDLKRTTEQNPTQAINAEQTRVQP